MLITLKILGIFISSFFGIYALLHEYRDKKGRITSQGRIAMIGIVLDIPHGGGLRDDIFGRSAAILVNHGDGDGRWVGSVELLAGLVGGIFVDF